MSSMMMRRPARTPIDGMFTVRRLFQPWPPATRQFADVEPMRPGFGSVRSWLDGTLQSQMRSSKSSSLEQISKRAARLGIETQYRDAQGQQQIADPEALARVT